jgi:hypothetical protein
VILPAIGFNTKTAFYHHAPDFEFFLSAVASPFRLTPCT